MQGGKGTGFRRKGRVGTTCSQKLIGNSILMKELKRYFILYLKNKKVFKLYVA